MAGSRSRTNEVLAGMLVGGVGALAVSQAVALAGGGRSGDGEDGGAYPLAGAALAIDRGMGLYLSAGQRRALAGGILCLTGAVGGAASALAGRYLRD